MQLSSVRAHRGVVHTPLRYPGGKTRLTGFLRRVIDSAGWNDCMYVEPYGGGAGAALSLLHQDVVPRIVINDLDPTIHAFWTAVTAHSSEFLALFDRTELSIEMWQVQREVYRARDTSNPVALGFATFFLNRTNRSGIMNAGVIGGQKQQGRYRIDARFNRQDLRSKLEWLGSVAHKITVSNRDGLLLMGEALESPRVFAYIDPPYFDKGSYLYLNSFAEKCHDSLAGVLREARSARWVLTYDDVPEIRRLYRGLYQGTFTLPYSAHTASVARERMVFSDAVARINWVMQ